MRVHIGKIKGKAWTLTRISAFTRHCPLPGRRGRRRGMSRFEFVGPGDEHRKGLPRGRGVAGGRGLCRAIGALSPSGWRWPARWPKSFAQRPTAHGGLDTFDARSRRAMIKTRWMTERFQGQHDLAGRRGVRGTWSSAARPSSYATRRARGSAPKCGQNRNQVACDCMVDDGVDPQAERLDGKSPKKDQ